MTTCTPLPAKRVQVGGQDAGQGLALTGLHLGDVAEVQRGAAHHLDVERPLVEHPPRRLAGHGERLGQQVVEVGPVGERFLNSSVLARSSASESFATSSDKVFT